MFSKLPENAIKELREHHPEKNEGFIQATVALTDIATNMLRESPEFRRAFAKIHEEFLKYPESRSTIEQALQAQKEFGPNPNTVLN
ncbi:hypothetical protein [Desulforamulus reducens]|nr:hypothetical protein [Desulforamulus reducens]